MVSPLILAPATAGLSCIASAALLIRQQFNNERRLKLPSHDTVPDTLIDKAAADVDIRFLVNGEPIEPDRFWQHVSCGCQANADDSYIGTKSPSCASRSLQPSALLSLLSRAGSSLL